jgi:hypothetical protein
MREHQDVLIVNGVMKYVKRGPTKQQVRMLGVRRYQRLQINSAMAV